MYRISIALVLFVLASGRAMAADFKDALRALREKNYPRVVEILDEYIPTHQRDQRAFALRGRAHVELGAFDKALADLNKAIEIEPQKNGNDILNRGRAYTGLRDYDKALADLNKAVELKPDEAERHFHRGNAHYHKLDFDAAFTDFHTAIGLDPKYTVAYVARGSTQWRRGVKLKTVTYQQGDQVYQVEHLDSVTNRDLVDQGLADLARAIEVSPDDASAYYMRAFIYGALKDWPKHIADMKQIARLQPKDADNLNQLAWILATADDDSLRNGKEAVELAEKACEQTAHKHFPALDTLAAALAEQRRFKRAVETQEKALAVLGNASPEVKKSLEQRLEFYKQKKPFRCPAGQDF